MSTMALRAHATKGNTLHTIAKLTLKERVFVDAYLADEDFNASAAAEKAGYKNPGQMGSKLIRKKHVKEYLSRALFERSERAKVSADDVLKEVLSRAMADPGKLFDKHGKLLPMNKIPASVRRNLSIKIETDGEGQICKYSWDRNDKALDLLCRHLGLLNDTMKVEHAISNDVVTKLLMQVEDQRSNVVDGEVIELEVKGE